MRKIIPFIVALMTLTTLSAQRQDSRVDSAELIVTQFLKMQDFNKLGKDSILYMETYIYYRSNPNDTAILKRWYYPPNRFRAELWHGDTLVEGCYTDGKKIHMQLDPSMKVNWISVTPEHYYEIAEQYDIRGSLRNWRADAAELKYNGIWDFNGHKVYRILVETPNKYNKNYMFECESGILFLIQETNEKSEYSNHQAYSHPDWHAYHEYQPIGPVLVPSVESMQVGNDMVFNFTHFKNLPATLSIFQNN